MLTEADRSLLDHARGYIAGARREPEPKKAQGPVRRIGAYGLTRRQADLLSFIRGYIADHGHSPSYEEMRVAFGFGSKSAVHGIVAQLVERGVILRMDGRSRSIVPLDEAIAVHLRPEVLERLIDYARRTRAKPETVIAEAVAAYVMGDAG